MTFDESGTFLASFSLPDKTLRIWKIGTAGFFGGILGMTGKHYKILRIEEAKEGKYSLIWEKNRAILRREEVKVGEIEV
jgi:hypothetical protein